MQLGIAKVAPQNMAVSGGHMELRVTVRAVGLSAVVGSLVGCGVAAESDLDASSLGLSKAALIPGAEIVISEVESSGGSPGDWVELMNVGSASINVSGWVFRDNDNA
jgi:hypothetical protein